ncbi:hypothetical protein B1748_12930 [Paenibacillus sp. MY03]|jgi:two-component system response regulator YesN|uniref:response regulator transcription factor n=1 Tax=Paenibacillus sp. MY03 TaxID=302980 RepID=UPI000B3C891B|nr:response regulator [Paenibacillus sp. MY03]OUS76166.1 hypothetical protein B1748_12930 [Paenibacillus sp. MY03]
MTYRVMLIDDEPWAMVYLKQTFNWEDRGFVIASEESNAKDALDSVKDVRPDVIFTDIRMPGLTGLELMNEVRTLGIECEFVIMSGFAEFSYAQEAITLGAFEYCLKPIAADKADRLLVRLRERLGAKPKSSEEPYGLALPSERNLKFEDMLDYIQSNIQDKLHLKELANQFYLNSNYCCHLFNKYTGKTFTEYVTELRMKKAAGLLANHRLTIEEAGSESGYPDYFYFNKVFKKYYGQTPSEYRKAANQP